MTSPEAREIRGGVSTIHEHYAVVDADVELGITLIGKKTQQAYRLGALDEARKEKAEKDHPERYFIARVTYEEIDAG